MIKQLEKSLKQLNEALEVEQDVMNILVDRLLNDEILNKEENIRYMRATLVSNNLKLAINSLEQTISYLKGENL